MERLKAAYTYLFSSYKRLAALLIIGGLLLIIPVSLSFVQQNQDIRQQASVASGASCTTTGNQNVGTANTQGNCDLGYRCNVTSNPYQGEVDNATALVAQGNCIVAPIPENPDASCTQALTPARNEATDECHTFVMGCLPEGWSYDSSCSQDDPDPVSSSSGYLTPGQYTLTGRDCTPNCEGEFIHNFTVTQAGFSTDGTFEFEGQGYYADDHSTTWNITGKIDDELKITWDLVYTGTNAGYTSKGAGFYENGIWAGMQRTSQNQDATWQITRDIQGSPPVPPPTLANYPYALNVNIKLPSIGTNQKPLNPTKDVELNLYGSGGQLAMSTLGEATYDPQSGFFIGRIPLADLPSGAYTAKVRIEGALWKQIPGVLNISQGSAISSSPITLVQGDVNRDNEINLTDYTLLLSAMKNR